MTDIHEFEIVREELHRGRGEDTNYDVIYRADSGEQMGVVTRQYQLITHKEAVDFVLETLDAKKIAVGESKINLIGKGKRMDCEIHLPGMRFAVRQGDEFDPKIVLRNGYDGWTSFGITTGVYRLVCLNGATVFVKDSDARLKHFYKSVDFKALKEPLISSVQAIASTMMKGYEKLQRCEGGSHLQIILKEPTIATKYKDKMLEDLSDYIQVKKDEKGKILDVIALKFFSAYVLWNILTAIITHQIKSIQTRRDMSAIVARLFFS